MKRTLKIKDPFEELKTLNTPIEVEELISRTSFKSLETNLHSRINCKALKTNLHSRTNYKISPVKFKFFWLNLNLRENNN